MKTLLAMFAVLSLASCADVSPSQDVARGPIGKADAAGSCSADDCGGQSPDGCWCDEACVAYGDCCANAQSTCEEAPKKSCGGLLGLSCGADEYCHYEESAQCGAADQLGTCEPLPEACIEIFAPVCGCDGQTYGNSCFAHAAGTSVASEGECGGGGQSEGEGCGGFLGLACADGLYCDYTLDEMCGAADHLGTCRVAPEACIEIFAPVCGCDGQTYGNGCFANAAGTSVAHEGSCDLIECGGFFALACPDPGMTCVDVPNDGCDPQNGGADCGGMCI